MEEAVVLAQLIAQLLPLGINFYNQVQQANAGKMKPIEEVLAAADANWDAISSEAAKQINNTLTGAPAAKPE